MVLPASSTVTSNSVPRTATDAVRLLMDMVWLAGQMVDLHANDSYRDLEQFAERSGSAEIFDRKNRSRKTKRPKTNTENSQLPRWITVAPSTDWARVNCSNVPPELRNQAQVTVRQNVDRRSGARQALRNQACGSSSFHERCARNSRRLGRQR